jgi:hypothetical protein
MVQYLSRTNSLVTFSKSIYFVVYLVLWMSRKTEIPYLPECRWESKQKIPHRGKCEPAVLRCHVLGSNKDQTVVDPESGIHSIWIFGDWGFNAKNTVSSFSQGLYLQVLWIPLRYTSKLMIYGFLNFFCVSEGGPPESRAQKVKIHGQFQRWFPHSTVNFKDFFTFTNKRVCVTRPSPSGSTSNESS